MNEETPDVYLRPSSPNHNPEPISYSQFIASNPIPSPVWIDWIEHIPARAYRAYPDGRIWSCESESFLRPEDKPYQEVTLKSEGFRKKCLVHRLIAHAFLGPPPRDDETGEELQVNHKSGNTHDNSLRNLEYVTRSENIVHRNNTLQSDKGGGVRLGYTRCPSCGHKLQLISVEKMNEPT